MAEVAVVVHYHWQWFWYLAGAVVTLIWKWQRYCYSMKDVQTGNPDGSLNPPITFWEASRKWWEMETLGSQVSWATTIGGVWVLGTIVITKRGADWLGGGIFMNVPVMAPMSFFIGSVAELVIPAITKWIIGKFGGDTAAG